MVLEGHFSHMFHADIVIVLRCKPTVLERRLRKKYKWPTKITENVEAEMIGLITDEALPLHAPGSIFEIDTTKRTARQTAKTIEKIVKNEGYARVKQMAGKIDWLRQI
jgi:adenylate kinase